MTTFAAQIATIARLDSFMTNIGGKRIARLRAQGKCVWPVLFSSEGAAALVEFYCGASNVPTISGNVTLHFNTRKAGRDAASLVHCLLSAKDGRATQRGAVAA